MNLVRRGLFGLAAACAIGVPTSAPAQCMGGDCGVGVLSSYYSYTSSWPAYYTTPVYVATAPMAPAYAVPARITPFRRMRLIPPMVPMYNPPIMFPIQ